MRWRHLILNNLWWKLLAFALALMIWSGSQNTENPLLRTQERTLYDVPVRVLALPAGTRHVRVEPASVQLQVVGEASLIRRLSPASVLAYIELPLDVFVSPVTGLLQVRLPAGIRLVNATPDQAVARSAPLE